MYDAMKEMRSRFPAPVDTMGIMGCDTAKWEEIDPRVRDHFIISLSPRLFNGLTITSQCSVSSAVVSFFAFDESTIGDSRPSFHSCSRCNQGQSDRRSCEQAPRGARRQAQPRGSANYRGVGHRGRHQQSRLLASQDTVCPHTTFSISAELSATEKREIQIYPTVGATLTS
jgi:hypothetical protein